LKIDVIKSSFNLQKIIKENNKSCQRWDNFNFGDDDDSSNKDSEGNQGVMILEDTDSPAEIMPMQESESPTPIFSQSRGRDDLTLDDDVVEQEE